jgi:hypothetical protein
VTRAVTCRRRRAEELFEVIRRAGRPIAGFDAQIAAITRVHGADLATRNVDDFDGCGIDVIAPWR